MRFLLLLCSALALSTACSQTPEPQTQKRESLAQVEPDPEPEDCVESDEVQRVLAARRQGFLACYADAVSLDPMLKGTVTLAFVIPPSGRVDHVDIARSDLDNAALHECITEVAAGLEFPQESCSLPRDIEYSVNLKRGSSEFVSSKD